MRLAIIYAFILSMEINKLIRLVCFGAFVVPFFGVSLLYSNTLMICCGIVGNNEQKVISPQVKFETPLPSALEIPKPEIKSVPASKTSLVNRFKKNKNTATNQKAIKGFRTMNTGKCGGVSLTSSPPSSPALFYYAPRIKSIRVSSPPNIDEWERSIREEMRLKGRSRQTVNRLLTRIQKYYDDPTIEASDYAPGNTGYQPSSESRELAETRIRRTVESMVEFFTKSKNLNMDESQSSNGSSMLKGKLVFINTQLDKLGKERVGMDELREIVSMKLNPVPVNEENKTKKDLKNGGLNQVLPVPQIAEMVPQPREGEGQIDLALPNFDKEKIVESNVESLYESFATWLVDNDKIFPSLDPEVDVRTLRYFDRINAQLRELGKFENMQIFREKTLAHLDEILDDRGQLQQPLDRASELLVPEEEDDPLFRGESRAPGYVHLASLPGKVIPSSNIKKLELSLPGSKVQPFDSLGNKRVFRVMDNLPGQIVY